jgi:hypothetical protein
MRLLQFWSDTHRETSIDVFVTEPFAFDEEFARALVAPLHDKLSIRFASLATSIRMKEEANRHLPQVPRQRRVEAAETCRQDMPVGVGYCCSRSSLQLAGTVGREAQNERISLSLGHRCGRRPLGLRRDRRHVFTACFSSTHRTGYWMVYYRRIQRHDLRFRRHGIGKHHLGKPIRPLWSAPDSADRV